MALQALIFDVDGTLADTERDGHRRAFNLAFASAGLDWQWDISLYGELLAVSGGRERIRRFVESRHPELAAAGGFEEQITRLHADKTGIFAAMLARGEIPLRPGVLRLLREARARGLRLAIATTTSPANVFALLRFSMAAYADWFEVIGAGDVVAEKKPAPDIYFHVLERMQLAPGECMAFEDSVNGLRAARGAGIKTIITVNEYTRRQDFSGAAIVLNHMGEPDEPFQVLSGTPVGDATYLDVDLIHKLYAAE